MYLKIISLIAIIVFASSCGEQGGYATLSTKGKLDYIASSAATADDNTKADLKEKIKAVNLELTAINSQMAELKTLLGEKEKAEPVEILSIDKSNFKRYVNLQAMVESDKNAMISPKMSGVVTSVNVEEGDYVSAGQILIEIDNSMQLRRLAQAKNTLSFIETVYNKQKSVWEKKVGSELEYLKAENDYENMLENIKLIEEEIKMLKVTAPFSGIVDAIMPKIGEAVAPGMGVVRLVSDTEKQIKVDFAENYITNFKKDDKVWVTFADAEIENLELKISSISKSIDSDKRTVSAYINVPSSYKSIKPNMTCVTRFNDLSVDSTIVIPLNVIQKSNEDEFVYFVTKNKDGETVAGQKKITTGESYKENIIVTSGLAVGDVIITNGASKLRDGKLIEITN